MHTAHKLCRESEIELNPVRDFHAERANHTPIGAWPGV
jgi:hypothetical protein